MAHNSCTNSSLRQQQDGFQSMVGGQQLYPDDPQHPDPTFMYTGNAQSASDVDAGQATVPQANDTATQTLARERSNIPIGQHIDEFTGEPGGKTVEGHVAKGRAVGHGARDESHTPDAKPVEDERRTIMDRAQDLLDKIGDRADDLSEAARETFAPRNPPFPTDDDPYLPSEGDLLRPSLSDPRQSPGNEPYGIVDREPANPRHPEPHTPTAESSIGRTPIDPIQERIVMNQMYGEREV